MSQTNRTDQNAYSFNALFITLKSSQEERIPLRMGVLNLVHELMHSFGAKHDPDPKKRPECTPEDKVGTQTNNAGFFSQIGTK